MPASGRPGRPQRLGPAGGDTHVAALLSDDGRAIVLWSLDAGGESRVYLDQSAIGVRFGPPRVLESFADPGAGAAPAGSPQLVRLSSESVMSAWAGSQAGRWVIRVAPIDQRGLRIRSTITAPGSDALLDALAPGPRGEAVILWNQPATSPSGWPEASRQTLEAARGIEAAPGIARFGEAETVAGEGAISGATVAIDPRSDRALAAWLGADGSIRWSSRAPAPPE